MNGIPTPCSKYYAEQKGITVLDVYNNLCKNKTIKFDLMIILNLYLKIIRTILFQMSEFIRKCKYIRDESDKSLLNDDNLILWVYI